MTPISTMSYGNRKVEVHCNLDGIYSVYYYIGEKITHKSHHRELQLAEEVAKDFIDEGSNGVAQEFLTEG